MMLGPRCLVTGHLVGWAGALGSQKLTLRSWDLDLGRVDPAYTGDGPLGVQKGDHTELEPTSLRNGHF